MTDAKKILFVINSNSLGDMLSELHINYGHNTAYYNIKIDDKDIGFGYNHGTRYEFITHDRINELALTGKAVNVDEYSAVFFESDTTPDFFNDNIVKKIKQFKPDNTPYCLINPNETRGTLYMSGHLKDKVPALDFFTHYFARHVTNGAIYGTDGSKKPDMKLADFIQTFIQS